MKDLQPTEEEDFLEEFAKDTAATSEVELSTEEPDPTP